MTLEMGSNLCSVLSVAVRRVPAMPASDSPARVVVAGPVVARLDQTLAELAAVVSDCTPVADAARIDRIARLEQLRSATAALQVDSPPTSMDAAPANAATTSEKCPAGTSPSSTAAATADRTPSTSPHPPATATAAAHPIHHEDRRLRRDELDQ
jgi:hypothetical protein